MFSPLLSTFVVCAHLLTPVRSASVLPKIGAWTLNCQRGVCDVQQGLIDGDDPTHSFMKLSVTRTSEGVDLALTLPLGATRLEIVVGQGAALPTPTGACGGATCEFHIALDDDAVGDLSDSPSLAIVVNGAPGQVPSEFIFKMNGLAEAIARLPRPPEADQP